MRRPRLEGAITFAREQILTLKVGANPDRTITIAEGEYYPSDLLSSIEGQAQMFAELAAFAAELLEGRAKITMPASCTLTWDETELPDALRFDSTPMTTTTHASQQCRGVYRSALPVAADRRVDKRQASVLLSAEAADVHSYGTRWHRLITLRALGSERSGAADELRALRLFWADHFGSLVRYYPDETIDGAFDADSEPYGYHVITLIGPQDFDPTRPQPNFWGRWQLDIEGVEAQA